MSQTYTITISEAQDKALSFVTVSQQEWIQNAVNARCQDAIEEIVNAEIQRKLAAGETISGSKEDIVLAADIETAAEKQARFEEERQG
jgi:hypothetical protein